VSALQCQQEATRLLDVDKKNAIKMMLGCMRRNDFTSLIVFTEPPWKGLRFSQAQYPLIIEVSMRRGGSEVAEDFEQLGIKVSPVDLFVADAKPDENALVSARVLPNSERQASDGTYTYVAEAYGVAAGEGGGFGSYTYSRGRYRYQPNESREVKPLGIVLELKTKSRLPEGKRTQIVGRYSKERSKALMKERSKLEQKLADSGLPASEELLKKPTLALDVVATEENVSKGAVEMAGGTSDDDDKSPYWS
jgi:hypothetical protein